MTRSFDANEIRRGAKLYELPITRAHDRPLNFYKRAASLLEVKRPIHRNDRGRAAQQPKNDPGVIWGIVDQEKYIIGAVANPEGKSRRHERGFLEPLNTQGR